MHQDRPTPKLSPREQQLLKFAAEGFTDTAIALRLGISEATVGTYWGRVRIKLGPYSRTELVALMLRHENEIAVENLRQENETLVKQLREHHVTTESASYHELLENAPDAMILVDIEGIIQYANLAALELFGYERDELIRKELLCLVPDRYKPHHSELRLEYMSHPDRKLMGEHLETPALHKSGKEFNIRASLSAITSSASTTVICAIRPILPES